MRAGTVGLRVRRAHVSDAAPVAALMRASIRGLAGAAYGKRRIALWSSLPPLYHAWAMTAGGETYLVAERGERILGYAALRGREVTAVFVHPGAAGRGIGRALLAALERLARRRAVRELIARAALGAVGFYERAGYERAGTARVPLFGGAWLPSVLVKKRVDLGRGRERGRARPATSGRRAAGRGSGDRTRGPPAWETSPPARRSAPGRRAPPSSRRSRRASRSGRPRAPRGPPRP